MKKTLIAILGLAIAASACKTAETEISVADSGIPVTLTAAQPDTRTYIEEANGGWQPYWSPKDSVYVTIASDYSKAYTFHSGDETGSITTQFSGKIEAGEGGMTVYAFRPKKSNRNDSIFKFMTGPEQHLPSLGTFDPEFDILVSQGANVTVEGQRVVSADKLQFKRMLAVVRIVLRDATTDKLLAGKKIKSIKLSSSTEVLSGELRVDIPNCSIDKWDNTRYNYVKATYDGDDWTADGSTGAFLLVAPVTFPDGSALTLDVETDDPDMIISCKVVLGQNVELPLGKVQTLKFGISEGDITDASQLGETHTWDFSTTAWQTEFKKYGSNDTNIENVNISLDGLSIVTSKGKFRPDCWQMATAGSTEDSYFKFTAGKDGVLTVKASHTGKEPDAEQAKRSVSVYTGGEESSVVAGVSCNTPKECQFYVKAGDVYIYCTVGPLRIYKIEFTEGGSASGGGEEPGGDEPETPGESADLECPNPPTVGTVEPDKLYGYAQAASVTGGSGATASNVLHFDNGKALQTWLLARTKSEKSGDHSPVTIWLSGTFGPDCGRDFSEAHPWFDVKDVSNLSFYGTDGFVMDRIGVFCVRASNIIIRNINFRQPKANNGADAISMQECNGVWVDHCTFTSLNQTKDYEDGSTDITHGSKNVTVSWCRYIKTQKSCLVGHSNSASSDTQITATFHHNWFDGSSSRHPRVRFGKVHVYNNLFDGCTTYGVGSAYGARVLVEYNYFDGVQLPADICTYPAKDGDVSNLQGSVAGYLYPTQNVYANRPAKARDPYPLSNVKYTAYNGSTITPLTYSDFKPAYDYVATAAESVPEQVKAGAGYGKLGWTEAPVAVNNGGISEFNGNDGDPTDPDPGNGEDEPGQPETGAHVYSLCVLNKVITQTKDGNTGASYFSSSESLADFSKDYKGSFTINDVTYTHGLKFDSKGSVSFTTSSTVNSTVQFWFARRKSADETAKIQITPAGGEAMVFETPYDNAGSSGVLALEKGVQYTIAQKAKEQALILVIVTETE